METLEGFKTTLRLEAGHCFTSLMTLKENQLPGLMQSLEFTVWSPECYSAKPDYPCDLLVYVAEEMRIYHITTEHQLEELIKSRKDEAKICGIRSRENRPYRLEGLSFSDELPVELLDFSTSDLELAHYALNDLCQLILPFAAQESLKSQLDLTEAFKTHLGRVLPRIVRSLTDYYDPENLEPFEKEVLDTKALEQRKIFFGLFLTDSCNNPLRKKELYSWNLCISGQRRWKFIPTAQN